MTGNLSRIGWKKMERAGLRPYFRFGAFAELAKDRAGLVRLAILQARRQRWIGRDAASRLSAIIQRCSRRASQWDSGHRGRHRICQHRGTAIHAPDVILPDLRSFALEMLF